MEKAREFQKNIYFWCFIDYAKAFDCVDHNKLWKILKEMGIPDHLPASWETCIQVKKQQLEPDMEQHTGSNILLNAQGQMMKEYKHNPKENQQITREEWKRKKE